MDWAVQKGIQFTRTGFSQEAANEETDAAAILEADWASFMQEPMPAPGMPLLIGRLANSGSDALAESYKVDYELCIVSIR